MHNWQVAEPKLFLRFIQALNFSGATTATITNLSIKTVDLNKLGRKDLHLSRKRKNFAIKTTLCADGATSKLKGILDKGLS
jgi:hypothetical protein